MKLEVEQGERFIPVLVQEMGRDIESVSLQKPTLNDVFLKLTGREIRQENITAVDRVRAFARRRH